MEVFEYGGLSFEWDRRKAAANLIKHGVSFRDAATTFSDDRAAIALDVEHSEAEERWRHIAISTGGDLVVTGYTHRAPRIRLIFARPATRRERHAYFRDQGGRRRTP